MDAVVALSVRVSTDRQAEMQTSEQQVTLLQAYADQHGGRVRPEHVFRDEGVSGARLDRPALDRLRDAAARGEIDTVLVTSPDRLARRYAYQVWLLEECERAGCRVVFLERPPSDDPQDALVIQMRGAVAEYERTVIADRMRRGRLAALRAGRLLPWTTAPYGYRLNPLTPRDPSGVRIEESEAALVRALFAWSVAEGLTIYAVAQRLTARGIPTAQGHAVWTPAAVRRILGNASYTGIAYGNQQQTVPAKRRHPLLGGPTKGPGGASMRLRPPEEWIGVPVPALISTELFALAQERLRRNRTWALRDTRHDYLLRCLVSCGRCGLAHHVWTNGRYAYYRCRGADALPYRVRPEPCRARQLPAAELDALVWADICAVLEEPHIVEDALRLAQQGWLHPDEQAARHADLVQRQRDLQRQIERLIEAYTAGVLALEEWGARRRKLEERLAVLRREEQHLAASVRQEAQIQQVADGLERFRAQVADKLAHADYATRRAIVELVVDRVVVDAPHVEIRYVIPFTGAAQRKGVLRPHYRAGSPGHQRALSAHARVWQRERGGALLCGVRGGAGLLPTPDRAA